MSNHGGLLAGVAAPKIRPGVISPFPEGSGGGGGISPLPSPQPRGARVSPFPPPLPLSNPVSPGSPSGSGVFSTTSPTGSTANTNRIRTSSLFGAPPEKEKPANGWAASQPALNSEAYPLYGGGRSAGLFVTPATSSPRASGIFKLDGASSPHQSTTSSPHHSTADGLLSGRRPPPPVLEINNGGPKRNGPTPDPINRRSTTASALFGAPPERFDASDGAVDSLQRRQHASALFGAPPERLDGIDGSGGFRRRRSYGDTVMQHHQHAVDDITPLPNDEDDDDDLPLAAGTLTLDTTDPLTPMAASDPAGVRRKPTFTEERRDRVPPLLPVPEKFINTSSWKDRSMQISIRDFDKVAHKLADVENAGWFEGHMNMQMLDELDEQQDRDDNKGSSSPANAVGGRRIARQDSVDEDSYLAAVNAAAQFRASLEADDAAAEPYVRHLVGAKPNMPRDKEEKAATLLAVNAAIAASNQSLSHREIISSAVVSPETGDGAMAANAAPAAVAATAGALAAAGSRRQSTHSTKAAPPKPPPSFLQQICCCFA
ncbi:hypothetical protein HDU89_005395 [Geranomyces variabilis]|nr:hypothetical protein HDU89_005395 [Geranomyces variabilis]